VHRVVGIPRGEGILPLRPVGVPPASPMGVLLMARCAKSSTGILPVHRVVGIPRGEGILPLRPVGDPGWPVSTSDIERIACCEKRGTPRAADMVS